MSAKAHFRIAGIPVHVQPVFFVIAGLFGLRYIDYGVDVVVIWVVTSFVSILVHELGHGISLKVFGEPSSIVLHGFGGVTISQRRQRLSRARSVIVSLAGSLTALLLLWLPMRQVVGSDAAQRELVDYLFTDKAFTWYWIPYFLAFQNLWWSIANLLPIRPLDGGNVTAEIWGLPTARRISIGTALAAALWAFAYDQTYAAFFALFLAFNNWQEIRAEREGAYGADAFHVDAPDAGTAPSRRSRPSRGRSHLQPVPPVEAPLQSAPGLDVARVEQQAWSALRAGEGPAAQRLVERIGPLANPYLRAAAALAAGRPEAFDLFEEAYVGHPSGPPNLVASEVLARTGAATALAQRLLARPDGAGREGAGILQTHLHYGDRFAEAASVGEAVFAAGPPSPAQTAFEVACSWARAGDVDRAVTWLEQAANAGFRAAGLVDGEPDLAAVRADPRWGALRPRLA
ncbi:MAG: TPR end-of-group domain-containing protein [Acidimicrobiia bacterium]|jgi:stage IV sporulation protein FB